MAVRCPLCEGTEIVWWTYPGVTQYWCRDCRHWWEIEAKFPAPEPAP